MLFSFSQNHSVARKWNELLLQSIRNDLARPTVHARNLFHISAAMYDAWSVFNNSSDTYFLNKNHNGTDIPYVKTKFLRKSVFIVPKLHNFSLTIKASPVASNPP